MARSKTKRLKQHMKRPPRPRQAREDAQSRYVRGVAGEVKSKAASDAANLIAYIEDINRTRPADAPLIPLSPGSPAQVWAGAHVGEDRRARRTRRATPLSDWMVWEGKTLARLYHASLARDADASPSLTLLALRFILDPTAVVEGSHQRYRWERTESVWVIREYPSSRSAGVLTRFPSRPVEVRHPVRIAILDCALGRPRDLTRLRDLIVARLGGAPEEPGDLPDPGLAGRQPPPPLTENERRVLEIIRTAPSGDGVTGSQVIRRLARDSFPLDQSALTRHVIPNLKKWHGVRNRRGVGYYIDPPTVPG